MRMTEPGPHKRGDGDDAESILRRAFCGHAYVTSDGVCLHCGEDVSVEFAAATLRLQSAIDQQLQKPTCLCGLKERPGSCGWCEE